MNEIVTEIKEMLDEDMVSAGLLIQCIKKVENDVMAEKTYLRNILTELLSSGEIEVGIAKIADADPDYVEFIAWKGSCNERVTRAMKIIDSANGQDSEFVCWLCLRENIDRYE